MELRGADKDEAMKTFVRRKKRKSNEDGMTMIEVLIASIVMVVGFMATLVLVLTAIASNNRNRMDSTSTLIAQAVVENISSVLVGSGVDNITDCAGNSLTINTAVGGATVSGSQIDFSQSVGSISPSDHQMYYAVCNVNAQATYDVRWNIAAVSSNTYKVTVGVKLRGQGNGATKFFALPVNLQTYVSN